MNLPPQRHPLSQRAEDTGRREKRGKLAEGDLQAGCNTCRALDKEKTEIQDLVQAHKSNQMHSCIKRDVTANKSETEL